MIRIFINLTLILLAEGAWLYMFIGKDKNLLSTKGLRSLRYFTVLSNHFVAISALLWLIKGNHYTEWIKMIAMGEIGVTFLVTALYLGFLYGHKNMYAGANLHLHMSVPLLCFIEYLFFCKEEFLFNEFLFIWIPLLLYACFYIYFVMKYGRKTEKETYDFYGFFTWGVKGFLLIALVLFIVSVGFVHLLDYFRQFIL